MSSTFLRLEQAGAAGLRWIEAAGPPLLYGLRLAGAVSLALFVAFALELDNPSWAGTSAGIVCQPILGASLRKGVFRMVGTVVGASMTVVMTGLFPQNRVGFLVGMALWAAACSFGNTLTRNFAAYGFALAGYTMAIIAGDSIPAPDQTFHLAITRASEIIIGIACAMAVTGLSELGRSRWRLAGSLERLCRELLRGFSELLLDPSRHVGRGVDLRRSLIGEVAALDPVIDQAIGEDAELRQRKAILRGAVSGLFAALSGWRIAESHLVHLSADEARRRCEPVAARLPRDLAALSPVAGEGARRPGIAAARAIAGSSCPDGVSERLLEGAAARVALGLGAAMNGLALLRHPAAARDPDRVPATPVADYLPATVNAIRTFVSISAAIAFWIATEWPNGLGAVTFVAVTVLLLAPQQDKAARAAFGFGIGTIITACLAAVVNFALLPNHESFPALALILGAFLVPMAALSTVPALAPYLVAATMNFVPLVGPSNQIDFDTLTFYNGALGIVGGCLAGALALVLIPPVPPRARAARLVRLTLRDLRRIACGRWVPTAGDWQQRVYARLIALPAEADPREGSRLVAALSTGLQVILLRDLAGTGAAGEPIRASLGCLALGDVDGMLAGLDAVDGAMSDRIGPSADLRAATAIQVIRDVVRQHRHEFEGYGG